jgi:S1-C subfamily serine protease
VAPPANDRRADRGRLARFVLVWGTVGGLLLNTLLPGVSEPAPAWTLPATRVSPTSAPSTVEPAPPPAPAPTSTPVPATTVAHAAEPAPPIDLAVAQLAGAWLVRVERGPSVGSGTVVGPDGLIVTTEEVVEGYAPIRVWLPDGQTLFAEILFEDTDEALALLGVADATPGVAPLVGRAETDEPVLLVGSGAAPGDPPVISRATLLAQQEQPASTLLTYRTDESFEAAHAAGSSLLDLAGNVVGIATRPGQVGVGVPAERVLAFVKEGEATWRALSRGSVQRAGPGLPGPDLPALVAQSVEPPVVEPGASLTLAYDILNPGATEQAAVLGASVRRDNMQAWTDDPADDTPVVVQPGRSVYRREFRLPIEARSGWYEVAWSVLSPDKSASYALETVARVVRVRPAESDSSGNDAAPLRTDAANIVPQPNVVRRAEPPTTPPLGQAVAAPPRPTVTPAARSRANPKPTPTPTQLPRRAPSPTPVRRR